MFLFLVGWIYNKNFFFTNYGPFETKLRYFVKKEILILFLKSPFPHNIKFPFFKCLPIHSHSDDDCN